MSAYAKDWQMQHKQEKSQLPTSKYFVKRSDSKLRTVAEVTEPRKGSVSFNIMHNSEEILNSIHTKKEHSVFQNCVV